MSKHHDPFCCIHRPEPGPRRNEAGDRLFTITPIFDTDIPMIRMRGRWLHKLGFRAGKRIVVVAKRNSLTITVEEAK